MMAIRKFLRICEVIWWAVSFVILALLGWIVLFVLIDSKTVWPHYVYALVALVLVVRNIYHRVKWYVCAKPAKIPCPRCHANVALTRYREEKFLNAPLSLYLPKMKKIFVFTGYKQQFYKAWYRPYLQLDCPTCGEKQVICPYCHEPITQESVECHYDKPTRCPHCGQRIYSLTPVQDSEDYIIIGDVID